MARRANFLPAKTVPRSAAWPVKQKKGDVRVVAPFGQHQRRIVGCTCQCESIEWAETRLLNGRRRAIDDAVRCSAARHSQLSSAVWIMSGELGVIPSGNQWNDDPPPKSTDNCICTSAKEWKGNGSSPADCRSTAPRVGVSFCFRSHRSSSLRLPSSATAAVRENSTAPC